MTRRDLIFRVFVSSTFNDLVEERNALQAKEGAFDNVRKYCRERGARFQAIDLRWGISAEAGLDQQTMAICRQELARCQEVSPRPNFILLLGNRYGWQPLPSRIDAVEFEELLEQVRVADRPLLTTGRDVPIWRDGQQVDRIGWYRKDLNAVPPEYVLQPRTIDFPGDASVEDRKRIGKEEWDDWTKVEDRIRSLLLTAARDLNWAADDPRRFKCEASATHQEIRAGALGADDPRQRVFCYFREIEQLPMDTSAGVYRDLRDHIANTDAERRLGSLKAELTSFLPPDHVHGYRAWWRNGRPEYDRRDLCNDVERDLKAVIDREIAAFRHKPAIERERDAHREFAEDRCRHCVGRRDLLQRMDDYLGSNNSHPLFIHGKSGSGKTAVMAKAVAECGARHTDMKVISRFVGATPGSSDLRSLLGDLCRELGVSEIPQDMNELVRTFRAQLSTKQAGGTEGETRAPPATQGKVVLFLDALDQLNPTDNARMLYWMPRELKPNVKVVVSVLETEQAVQDSDTKPAIHNREDPFDLARRIWPGSLVEVGALDEASGAELLDAWLGDAGRTLQEAQRQEVLSRFARCPLPLYLKLATQEAFGWKSWRGVVPLGGTVDAILEQMLARLERPENHGRTLVSRSLRYIATGKNGLTEDEMLDVLSRDKAVTVDFAERSPESPRVDSLPVVVWSRLFADIRSYMTTRRADGTVVVMDFYHRQVAEAVRRRYLPTEDSRAEAHLQLAEYFDSLDFWAESLEAQRARAKRLPPTPRPANVRKVVELPYHRLEVAKLVGKDDPKSEHWDAVTNLLTNAQFLEAKAEADPNFQEQESVEPKPKSEEAKP